MFVSNILLPLLTFLGSYWKICTTKPGQSIKEAEDMGATGLWVELPWS